MDGGGNRAEAERWLYTANKLLTARDLHGARSFAIRARESDPTFDASELLLTVIDTLLAGEARINDHLDWYAILQVLRYTQNIEYIAAQYRRLAILLDPHRNPFSFSGHAFSLVHDAWSVLCNPAKKAMYDNELRLLTDPPPPAPLAALAPAPNFPIPMLRQNQHQHQDQQQQHLQMRKNPRSNDGRGVAEEERPSLNNVTTETTPQARTSESTLSPSETEVRSFWTACPYCYVMYEYPKVYEDCTLRCQSCRRGFHAVMIRSPVLSGNDGSFCSWGFFPLGFSGNFKDVSGSDSNWNPFSPLFPCSLKGANRRSQKGWVLYDDEAAAAFIELSDPSEDDSDDDDWRRTGNRRMSKRIKRARRKGSATAIGDVRRELTDRPRMGIHSDEGHSNVDNGGVEDGGSAVPNAAARPESSKKVALSGSRRRAAGNLGKLDLNVEFNNEGEEPARGATEGNGPGHAEENIEGIGFFEGLDEFLSSLPILNVVADDKVKGH